MNQRNKSQLQVSDALEEKIKSLEEASKAMLNILEDFNLEKLRFEETQRASFNILEDFNAEKLRLENTESATLNILDDFNEEKSKLEETQKATLNILEDFDTEKMKVETANLTLSNEIGERRQAEERIKKLNEQLEGDAVQLETSNKELEAFSYSVSHDLRAPLRHISGFTDLLQKNSSLHLDEKSNRYLNIIADSTKQMGLLIDNLLDFSRMGRASLKYSRIDVNELLNQIIEELKDSITNKNLEWKINNLPIVNADFSLLKITMVNLMNNAVKYSSKVTNPIVEVGYSQPDDGEVVIYVKDNGTGFNMKYADKLFGVFQRLHSSQEYEGTGIGLATVRRIIHKHGGKTWAKGEEGKGATFYFSLPVIE